SAGNAVVEQFTTRLDLTGKILAIDTSGVSSTYSQYLNKDLVGKTVLELCHPNDFHKVEQHLKEALSTKTNVISNIYRLMVATDKYVHVQTKYKAFNGAPPGVTGIGGHPTGVGSGSGPEATNFIMAIHSIIRDSENSCSSEPSSSRGGTPSPITTVAANAANSWSGNPTFASTIANSVGSGGGTGGQLIMTSGAGGVNNNLITSNLLTSGSTMASTQPMTVGPVIYANTQTGMISTQPFPPFPALSLSPSAVSDFTLNDCLGGIGDMYSYDMYDTNSQESQQQQQHQTSANTSTVQSMTMQSMAPTSSSAMSSSSVYTTVTTAPANTMASAGGRHQTTNLLTQGSSYLPDDGVADSGGGGVRPPVSAVSMMSIKKEPGLQNDFILRELLEEDEDIPPVVSVGGCMSSVNDPTMCGGPLSVGPQPHTPAYSESSCPGSVGSDSKKVANNNNMLRMLLNDDEVGKRTDSRKSHEIVEHYLLKDNNPGVGPAGGDHTRDTMLSSLMAQQFKREPIDSTLIILVVREERVDKSFIIKTVRQTHSPPAPHLLFNSTCSAPSSSSGLPTSLSEVMATTLANKRKSIDDTATHYEPQTQDLKRPASAVATGAVGVPIGAAHGGHSHQPALLAGQNPMLASMLARTPTSVPEEITIPPSMISQTPDAKLPRNLEKKLMNPTQGMPGQHQQHPQQQQLLQQQVLSQSSGQVSQSGGQVIFASVPQSPQTSSQQPMIVPIVTNVTQLRPQQQVIEPSTPSSATGVPNTPTTPQPPIDLNERMAISAIQKQLMSFEVTTPTTPTLQSPFATQAQQQAPSYQQIPPPAYTAPSYVQQMGNTGQQGVPSPQANFQLQPRPQGPRLSKPRQQYLPQNMQLNPNLTQVAAAQMKAQQMTPQMRRQLSDNRKTLAEQQKQRLLAQQSLQQMIPQTQQSVDAMSFQGFPENMNELLNNSVAPNVALSVKPRGGGGGPGSVGGPHTPNSLSDVSQLSPRYPMPMSAGGGNGGAVPSPLPQSPAPQLSPGPAQLRQPFSPATGAGQQQQQQPGQQSYPSPSGTATAGYPTANQHRMSPHFVSSPSPAQAGGPNSPMMVMSPQTNSWAPQSVVRPPPQMPQNSQQSVGQNVSLQQTNPMLNAQLSGSAQVYANTGPQQQQQQRFPPRAMRAAAPPQPRNSRSSPYPDQQFAQQFVGQVVVQQQQQQVLGVRQPPQPQQRMAIGSIPAPMRVNSPRFAGDQSLPSPNQYPNLQPQQQSYGHSPDGFNFDQAFGGNGSQPATPQPGGGQQQNDRSRNNSGMTSDSGINSPVSHLNLNIGRPNAMDDSKPSDQKKSLLQQLLSEPS
ncbi:unnamed protein product, partial [Medioppia subpectinata]